MPSDQATTVTKGEAPRPNPSSFATAWQRYDRMMEGFEHCLLTGAGLHRGQRVIDVGCGAGTTSLNAARAVGAKGQVLGVDRDADVLAVARKRGTTARLPQLRFQQARVGHDELELNNVDAIVSRFGTLHFDEPVAAYSRLRDTLRDDGCLAFVCAREAERNAWATVPARALQRLLPGAPRPEPDRGGPFVFADPDRVRSVVSKAGFHDIQLTSMDMDVFVGTDVEDAARFFFAAEGRKAAPLIERIGLERAHDALCTALAAYTREAGIWMGASAWLVTARS